MKRWKRPVQSLSGFSIASLLPAACQFLRPPDLGAKRVVARVPMPGTAGPRLSIQEAYAHFSPREIGERLSEEQPRGWRGGLRRRADNKLRCTPRPDRRQN